MSVVVALKYKDGVMLGADRQFTYRNRIDIGEAQKIFESKYSVTGMGIVGSLRGMDVIACNTVDLLYPQDILEGKELTKDYIVNNIVTDIFTQLTEHRCIDTKDISLCMDNNLILVSKNKIFVVYSDGSVLEHTKYACIGCGDELATGYLSNVVENTEKLSEFDCAELIRDSIIKSCKNDVYIGNHIDILKLSKEGRQWIAG